MFALLSTLGKEATEKDIKITEEFVEMLIGNLGINLSKFDSLPYMDNATCCASNAECCSLPNELGDTFLKTSQTHFGSKHSETEKTAKSNDKFSLPDEDNFENNEETSTKELSDNFTLEHVRCDGERSTTQENTAETNQEKQLELCDNGGSGSSSVSSGEHNGSSGICDKKTVFQGARPKAKPPSGSFHFCLDTHNTQDQSQPRFAPKANSVGREDYDYDYQERTMSKPELQSRAKASEPAELPQCSQDDLTINSQSKTHNYIFQSSRQTRLESYNVGDPFHYSWPGFRHSKAIRKHQILREMQSLPYFVNGNVPKFKSYGKDDKEAEGNDVTQNSPPEGTEETQKLQSQRASHIQRFSPPEMTASKEPSIINPHTSVQTDGACATPDVPDISTGNKTSQTYRSMDENIDTSNYPTTDNSSLTSKAHSALHYPENDYDDLDQTSVVCVDNSRSPVQDLDRSETIVSGITSEPERVECDHSAPNLTELETDGSNVTINDTSATVAVNEAENDLSCDTDTETLRNVGEETGDSGVPDMDLPNSNPENNEPEDNTTELAASGQQINNDLQRSRSPVSSSLEPPNMQNRSVLQVRRRNRRRRNRSETPSNQPPDGGSLGNNSVNDVRNTAVNVLKRFGIETEENVDLDKIRRENQRMKNAKLCPVCKDRDADKLFLPCAHLSSCSLCSPALTKCPQCRTNIRGIVSVFFA